MADERASLEGTERVVPAVAQSAPQLLIVASDGTWTSRLLSDVTTLTLGRGPEADVRVNEPSVSRLQARIEVLPEGQFRLTDLDSANGTMVGANLIKSTSVSLRPGQPVLLGRTVVVVQAPLTPAPPTAVSPAPTAPRRSAAMTAIDQLVSKIAPTMINVLVRGETGVGKDVVAQRIHQQSTRATGPFVRLNCAGLSAQLLESELFGHEKGAFTGAVASKPGLLEVSAGGTVFLDEVGEMPLEVQAKLLVAIEQRVARRVGSNTDVSIDVRFVCATHRDLEDEIRRGRFRADFFYRINGFTISIPALRDRRDELEELVHRFANEAASRLQRSHPPTFEPDALARLFEHAWPGNIRELRNVVERAVLLADNQNVTRAILAPAGLPEPSESDAQATDIDLAPDEMVDRENVRKALAACGGNQSRAAQLLGISRNTLLARIRRYGIIRPRGPVRS